MAQKKVDEPKIKVGNITDISGEVTIAGGDIHKGFTAEQVSVLITQITTTFEPKKFDGRSPYKGLDVFEEEDAELFFGREKLVDDLVRRVKDSRTVFVTGPSGSGKSSLVRAGLIHALKEGAVKELHSERWLYATMKPGRDPVGELARVIASLASSTNAEDEVRAKALTDATIFARWCEIALKEGRDKRAVLFIDQFEEVFTQISKDAERIAFLNLLTHAATVENGRVIILFSMRSDFVSNCATYPQLNDLLNRQFVQIGAMQPDELVSAIAQPALRVGLRIDPDLIAQIINDMKSEPGALPLMQFALKDLFDAQQAKGGVIALTLNDYFGRGGIRKALERHADSSFAKLNQHEQELTRSIFSGLIEIGRGTQDTRRTANFDELIPASAKAEEVQAIVQKLADARLITTDETAGNDTVTISHEKLIDAWPWLKKLVNENRDVIALQNEIAADAKEWDEHQRDASYLYSGARLVNANEKLKSKELVLSGTAFEYIRAGQARQQRNRLILISTVSAVIGLLILALIIIGQQSTLAKKSALSADQQRAEAQKQAATAQAASTLAVEQKLAADNNANTAHQQTTIALARQLAALAQQLSTSKPQTAVLLAVQSMRLLPAVEAAQVLQTNSLPRAIASMTHAGPVHSVAFSPDGKYVVSAGCNQYDEKDICNQGSARIWVAITGKEVARMTYDGDVYNVRFSADGQYVVSEGCDQRDTENKCTQGSARVWEATTGREIAHMTHAGWVRSIAISSDGKYVVSGSDDKTVRVWEATTGKEVARVTHDGNVNSVAFSPDGKFVVSGSDDGTARVWAAATGKEIARVTTDGQWISAVAFSPDGKFVASAVGYVSPRDPCMCGGGGGGDITIWVAATGRVVAHTTLVGDINTIAFSPDGKYVVSGGRDNTAHVWEVSTGKEVARMTHHSNVNSVAFSPDGKYVVSGSDDNSARVWETATGREVARMTHDGGVNSVAFSPDGKYVVSGSRDNIALVWGTSANEETNRTIKIDDNGYTYTLSPDGRYFVSLSFCGEYDSADNCVSTSARVWATDTGEQVASITNPGDMSTIVFSPNGKYLVSQGCEKNASYGCAQNSIHVWAADTGKEVASMTNPGDLSAITFSPDGKYLISWGCEKYDSDGPCAQSSIHVWIADTGKEVARMTHNGNVNSVAFSPDGKYVVSGSDDKTARVWEAATGKEVNRITHDGFVYSVAFSPDGKYVASGVCDQGGTSVPCIQGSVHMWVVATGKEVVRITYEGDASSVNFSPDGKYVVLLVCDKHAANGTCTQGTAHTWEAATGREVPRITYSGAVTMSAFNSNGKDMVSGGCDKRDASGLCTQGSASVWAIVTGQEVARMTHEGDVSFTAFSPDGKYVISGGCDEINTLNRDCTLYTTHVWVTETGKEVARMTHEGNMNFTSFSPDGKYVISGGCDELSTLDDSCTLHTTFVWMYRPEDLMTDACSRMERNLTRDEWDQYIGNILPYQAICPNLPLERGVTSTPTVSP